MIQINEVSRQDRPLRREWQAPRVIESMAKDSESKTHGAATPDSHYLSNDYGNTS